MVYKIYIVVDCSLYEMLAEIYLKTGKYEQAAECAETAVEQRTTLGPKNSSGSTSRR